MARPGARRLRCTPVPGRPGSSSHSARGPVLDRRAASLEHAWTGSAAGRGSARVDGGVTSAAIDRAEAGRSELAAKLRQAQDGIAYQVGEAHRKALEAEGVIAARELALKDAEEAQRLVKKRYENGLGTLIELLGAQAQLDKANADLIAGRYELAVQRAELKRAVGVLDSEQI